MYCEKCGKANPENVTKCKYCGTVMPQKTSCGGFGDILSYENSEQGMKEGVTAMNTMPAKAPEKESSLAPILSIIAIGVSAVAIILSIVAMVMCASVDTNYDEDIDEETETRAVDEEDEEIRFVAWLNNQDNECKQDVKDAFMYFYNQENENEEKALESICDVESMKDYAEKQPAGKIEDPNDWAERIAEKAQELTEEYKEFKNEGE